MLKTKRFAIGMLTLSFSFSVFGQQSPLFGNLKKGIYDVGYKIIVAEDYSRVSNRLYNFRGEKINDDYFRTIPINVWYPGVKGIQDSPMKVKDYYYLKESSLNQSPLSDHQKLAIDKKSPPYENGLIDEERKFLLNIETEAYLNIENANNIFPLLIFNSLAPVDNHILCEYLASHGFVVLSVPFYNDIGNYFGYYESWDAAIRDVQFAINRIAGKENVDLKKIGIIGASHGGNIAPTLQILNPNVKCVVSLDGMEKWNSYNNFLDKTMYGRVDKKKINTPYLIFQDESQVNVDSFYIKNATYANKTIIEGLGLSHGFFSCLSYVMYEAIAPSTYVGNSDISNEHPVQKMEIIGDYVLNFMNAHLKSIPIPENTLENNAIADSLKIRHINALPIPPSQKDLEELLIAEGIEGLSVIIDQFSSDISERHVENLWIDLYKEKNEMAEELFSFLKKTFPRYSSPFYLLAYYNHQSGDLESAKVNYQKFLELVDDDPYISANYRNSMKEHLKKLFLMPIRG